VSATEEAQEQADDVSQFTSIFRYFLLAFGAIALFVGAFVIFNTFSITSRQRTREFATCERSAHRVGRCSGLDPRVARHRVPRLSRRPRARRPTAEGIEALFGSLGVELPTADRVFATRTVVVSLIVGVGITLLAGLFPAIRRPRAADLRGTRRSDSPAFAVRSLHAVGRRGRHRRLAAPPRPCHVHRRARTGDRLLSIAGGVLLLFLGVAMLSSKLVTPIAAVVGIPPARQVALRGGSPVETPSAIRSRTAAPRAALMIGIALVAFIATAHERDEGVNREAIEEQIAADYVVTSRTGTRVRRRRG
jgi:putative ABC transport system permease protein